MLSICQSFDPRPHTQNTRNRSIENYGSSGSSSKESTLRRCSTPRAGASGAPREGPWSCYSATWSCCWLLAHPCLTPSPSQHLCRNCPPHQPSQRPCPRPWPPPPVSVAIYPLTTIHQTRRFTKARTKLLANKKKHLPET